MPITASTSSVAQTRGVAAALAELARPGDVLLLVGDLGAGKTAFTQGFGAALTDSAATELYRLSPAARTAAMRTLFDPETGDATNVAPAGWTSTAKSRRASSTA